MKKWEYLAEELALSTPEIKKALNIFGEARWELVAVVDVLHYFKREKLEEIKHFDAD